MKIPGYLMAEMVALLIGIWRFGRLPDKPFRALVYFLAFIVCVEWYGRVVGTQMRDAIGMVYNYSLPFEYMFYIWFLSAQYTKQVYIRLSRVYILGFAIFTLANNMLSSEAGFHGIYMKIGILGLLLFCSLYFAELLRRDQIVNPISIPVFWICCGLFIFNLGEFVYGFGIARLAENPKAWKTIFQSLNSNLNVVLYSCISVAFLMASWKR